MNIQTGSSMNEDAYGPNSYIQMGSSVYFGLYQGGKGNNLWKSDGTVVGTRMVKEFPPRQSDNNAPGPFAVAGSTLFFWGDAPGTGMEMWKTDGTPEGTMLLKDINPGIYGSFGNANISKFIGAGSYVYFGAYSPDAGRELWRSDGTTAGTVRVKDLNPGSGCGSCSPYDSNPQNFINANGKVFFTARTQEQGEELWTTDGTSVGTILLRDITSGSIGANISGLTAVGSSVYFSASDNAGGYELWKSDGTEVGTVMVANLVTAPFQGANPQYLTELNGELLFWANDAAYHVALYKTDGTTTALLVDLNPNYSPLYNVNQNTMTKVGNVVYFTAWEGDSSWPGDLELYKTDGTAVGTVKVGGSPTLGEGTSAYGLTAGPGGNLFFLSYDLASGGELWTSDGTTNSMVKDIYPGTESGMYGVPFNVGSYLIFFGQDGVHGVEPWASNGTSVGTTMLRDITVETGSDPRHLTELDGKVYFAATSDAGRGLWVADSTDGGVQQLLDVNPGTGDGRAQSVTRSGSNIFFVANDGTTGNELYVTDGGIPTMVKNIGAGAASAFADPQFPSSMNYFQYYYATLFPMADKVYFTVQSNSSRLWRSDGLTANTLVVPSTPTSVYLISGTGDNVIFNSSGNQRLYRAPADGGTASLAPGGSNPSSASGFTRMGDKVYFSDAPSSDNYDTELWVADVDGNISQVANINGGSAMYSNGSYPSNLADIDGTLYFSANDGVVGSELWKSDGTDAGTVMVKDIDSTVGVNYPNSSNPSGFTLANGEVFFRAEDSVHGRELWKTDGTTAGTVLVKDIQPGRADGVAEQTMFTIPGGPLLFVADNGQHGKELWVTYGTEATTVMVQDIGTGGISGRPTEFTLAGTTLYFAATDGEGDRELWSIPLAALDVVPPVIACPANVSIDATSGAGALVTYPAAIASDNSGTVLVTYTQDSGTAFPIATTQVTATATDAIGNEAVCSFDVTVVDPTIVVVTPDAGGGSVADSGVPPEVDAGTTEEEDAGTSDAGTSDAGTPDETEDVGCAGCSGGAGATAAMWLGLLALPALRRRSRRGPAQ